MHRALASLARRLVKIKGNGSAPEKVELLESPPTGSARPVVPTTRTARPEPPDVHVQQWKGTWVTGAESRWAGSSVLANPHKAGSTQAAAWRAGWHWADRQPDRRQPNNVRFAHGHRRRADRATSPLVRRTQAGAVGLSMLTIAGWLWQIRRQRRAVADKASELKL
jgi:hypothetical protein